MSSRHNMLKKAFEFYRLAADEPSIWTKEDYDTFVSEIDTHYVSQMMDVINEYHNKEYFKLEDFLEPMWQQTSFYSIINFVDGMRKQQIPENIIKSIIQYMMDKELGLGKLGLKEYLIIEKFANLITPETLARAQRKIILKLIELFKFDMVSRTEDGRGHRTAEVLWRGLWDQSTKFPKAWLEELAKKFDIDFYINAMPTHSWEFRNQKWDDVNTKDTLTSHDIGLLFSLMKGQSPEEIQKIIAKADEKAFAYMREFLYTYSPYPDEAEHFYMLDENGKLMDENYNIVEWPPLTYAIKPSKIRQSEIKEKWKKIMGEFNVIPL